MLQQEKAVHLIFRVLHSPDPDLGGQSENHPGQEDEKVVRRSGTPGNSSAGCAGDTGCASTSRTAVGLVRQTSPSDTCAPFCPVQADSPNKNFYKRPAAPRDYRYKVLTAGERSTADGRKTTVGKPALMPTISDSAI